MIDSDSVVLYQSSDVETEAGLSLLYATQTRLKLAM